MRQESISQTWDKNLSAKLSLTDGLSLHERAWHLPAELVYQTTIFIWKHSYFRIFHSIAHLLSSHSPKTKRIITEKRITSAWNSWNKFLLSDAINKWNKLNPIQFRISYCECSYLELKLLKMSFTENDVHNQPCKGNYDRVGTKTTEMMLWS